QRDWGPERTDTVRRKGASSSVGYLTAAISSPKNSWPCAPRAIDKVDLPVPLSPAIRTPAPPIPTEAAWKNSTSGCIRITQLIAQVAINGCQDCHRPTNT